MALRERSDPLAVLTQSKESDPGHQPRAFPSCQRHPRLPEPALPSRPERGPQGSSAKRHLKLIRDLLKDAHPGRGPARGSVAASLGTPAERVISRVSWKGQPCTARALATLVPPCLSEVIWHAAGRGHSWELPPVRGGWFAPGGRRGSILIFPWENTAPLLRASAWRAATLAARPSLLSPF